MLTTKISKGKSATADIRSLFKLHKLLELKDAKQGNSWENTEWLSKFQHQYCQYKFSMDSMDTETTWATRALDKYDNVQTYLKGINKKVHTKDALKTTMAVFKKEEPVAPEVLEEQA